MSASAISVSSISPVRSAQTVARRLHGRFKTLWGYAKFLITNALPLGALDKPRAVVWLNDTFRDIHDRRYFFLILQTLIDCGYAVRVVWKISFAEYRQLYRTYEGLAVRLKSLRVVSCLPKPSKSVVLFTNVTGSSEADGWKQVFELDCDILSARQSERELRMPYFMHPEQFKHSARRRLAELRGQRRELRIFFSGNLAEHAYQNPLPGNKPTRFQIVQALLEMPAVEHPADEAEFRQSFSAADNRCVVHDRHKFTVQDEDWLPTIARCDFFLCLPGSRMPMCHNAIEAMAVGTIPILNYGDWFDPPLRHGETCFEFSSMEDLQTSIKEILELPPDAVARLRQNVIHYYEQHLSAAAFRTRLEQVSHERIRLLVNTEYPWHESYQAA